VPAAIHLSPEALGGGPIAKLRDGDVVRVCAATGQMDALVDQAEWNARENATSVPDIYDTGRELFALFRNHSDLAEQGASAMLSAMDAQLAD
jgi:phosphogluconate dehydratase